MTQFKNPDALIARVDDLESQLAFQEDTIEALNKQVQAQSQEIELLRPPHRIVGHQSGTHCRAFRNRTI